MIELRASGYSEDITVEAPGHFDGFIAPYALDRWRADIRMSRVVPPGVFEDR